MRHDLFHSASPFSDVRLTSGHQTLIPLPHHFLDKVSDGPAFQTREFSQAFGDFGLPDLDGGIHDVGQSIMISPCSQAAP